MMPLPSVRVAGGYLRDARERRCILPEEPAERLGVSVETLVAMEAGHFSFTPEGISRLCHLYRCPKDEQALRALVNTTLDHAHMADFGEGHHRRLAGCGRQAREVRWLSTALVPPPLQTAAYARVIGYPSFALPDAPLPSPHTVYVLAEHVLRTHRIAPAVMASQLQHLLELDGNEVRVVPGRIARYEGQLVDLGMPAGSFFALPGHDGVLYMPPSSGLFALMSDTWGLTTSAASRELLLNAAREQLSRAHVRTGVT